MESYTVLVERDARDERKLIFFIVFFFPFLFA